MQKNRAKYKEEKQLVEKLRNIQNRLKNREKKWLKGKKTLKIVENRAKN